MRGLIAALYVEALKARRSLVPWVIGVFTTLPPIMLGLMMAIKKNPAGAERFGLLNEKSRLLVGAADWPSFLGLVGQTMAAMGAVAFSVLAAWVFGREFADRTCRIMLAVPTRRSAMVAAKLAVTAGWCLLLSAWILLASFVIGVVVGMPGLTWQSASAALAIAGRAALLWLALMPVTAFVASAGRGYLLPIGYAMVTVIIAQFLSATGWAAWFPWCVAITSGVAETHITGASVAVVVLTGVLGIAAVLLWWERSDQTL